MGVTFRAAAAAAVLVAVVAVTGCAAGERPRAKLPTKAADTSKAQGLDKVFVDDLRSDLDTPYSDKELVSMGRGLCEAVEDGGGWAAIQEVAEAHRIEADSEMFGTISGTATWHFCPDQIDVITELFSPDELSRQGSVETQQDGEP